MGRTQPAFWLRWLLLLLAVLALLPTPHPEVRLFSDGWGASSFVDPDICLTPIEGKALSESRMPLFPKAPAAAQAFDRLSLALLYLVSGLLLPVFALVAVFHRLRDPLAAAHRPALPVFGLLGLAPAWFQWPLNPAFIDLRQWLAGIWLAHWPLTENQLVWLDGITWFLWLGGGTLLAGGACLLTTHLAARLAGLDENRLVSALVPLAGITVFLGLTQTTALYLRGEGVSLDWLPGLRAALLALAVGAAGWMGLRRLAKNGNGSMAHKAAASLLWLVPPALTALHGWAMYFHWTDRYHA